MCSICVPELTVAKDAVAAPNAATRVRQCHLSLYRPRAGGPDLHEIPAPTRCRPRPHMPRGVCKAHSDGSRQGGRRRLVSPGSGRVCGQILAGLPLDAAQVPARPYRAPGWARRCPPARGHAPDDSVSMARGCRAEPSVPSCSSACDAAGIRWHRRLAGGGPAGGGPGGMAASAGQENDHPCDSQARWTLRRPNAPAYTSLPVALSRSLSM